MGYSPSNLIYGPLEDLWLLSFNTMAWSPAGGAAQPPLELSAHAALAAPGVPTTEW